MVRYSQRPTRFSVANERLRVRLRELAEQQGWLKPDAPLPDDAEIAAALGPPHKARSTVSGLEVHRALIASWLEQNVPGTAILAALRREHGYTGSYSSVYRMIVSINADRPPDATVPLSFAPGGNPPVQ